MSNNHDMFPEIPDDALERMTDPEILKKWPQGLTDILLVIEAVYRRHGDNEEIARARAFRAVRALAHFHGGHSFYLPKGDRLEIALRDREIFERHNGANVTQLAREHRLTEVQVYSILAEQRKLARNRLQPGLF
ncbi:Mor transcription activator family protein [Salinicola sp. RZ23]|uniref:Mor transcription activator family protein n=1 Tax=Salinicola sp. RZ23 TaxID=1949087 RepID=UPI0013001A17|nr:Mor transcription activator family protein [Salinicola sp. RZ23]